MSKASRFAILLTFGVAATILPGCSRNPSSAGPVKMDGYVCQGCNVVLVSVDTLRADRLSVYGYDRPTSPFLEELAADGVVFEQFVQSGGGTLPSHMTMFTSLYPATHQVEVHTGTHLEDEWTTLAEALKLRGYSTAAYTDGGWMSGKFGFARGFDVFDDRDVHGHLKASLPKAYRWIEKNQNNPFFVFLHTYDVHSQTEKLPYECPGDFPYLYTRDYSGDFDGCIDGRCASDLLVWLTEGATQGTFDIGDYLAPEDLEFISSLYDGCINYVDTRLAELAAFLKERDLYDRTLIVVTTDHGEEFMDHGLLLHVRGGYEELVRIPLVMKLPGSTVVGKRVSQLATMVDVVPTILDVLGIPIPEQAQGHSLMPAVVRGARVRRVAHIYNIVRTERWKYFGREGRLFDLVEDPKETRDVAADHPDLVENLERVSRELIERDHEARRRLDGTERTDTRVELTSEEIQHLKSLGYLN
jgi:arylsulfatase A-like enzyme